MPTTRKRRSLRTRPGSATLWGAPGVSAAAVFERTGAAGRDGEISVATKLLDADLPAGTLVFHDVVPAGGTGNVDHVVIRGDVLVAIDAKQWRPGRYETRTALLHRDVWDPDRGQFVRQHTKRAEAWRDGERFEPGDASAFPFLVARLVEDIGWRGRVFRVVVVCSSSDTAPVRLDGFDLGHSQTIGLEDLPSQLAATLRRSRPLPVAATANRLLDRTTQQAKMATPFPAGLDGPAPVPASLLSSRKVPVGPAKSAVALCAASSALCLLGLSSGPLLTLPLVSGAASAVLFRRAALDLLEAPAVVVAAEKVVGPSGSAGAAAGVAGAGATIGVAGGVVSVAAWAGASVDHVPLLPATAGFVDDLRWLVQAAAIVAVVGAACSGFRSWAVAAAQGPLVRWKAVTVAAARLRADRVPLLALAMGEQDDALRWFTEMSALSRSTAWRDFADEAARQAPVAV